MKFNANASPGLTAASALPLACAIPTTRPPLKPYQRPVCGTSVLRPGLRAYGVKESQLDAMSDQAFEDTCHQTNPVPVTREYLRSLYQLAL